MALYNGSFVGSRLAAAGLAIACAAMLSASAAQAQYRDDQPAVLEDQRDDDDYEFVEINEVNAMQNFNGAYAAAGKPRMALFWNREFSDRLSQWAAMRRAVSSGSTSIQGPLFGRANAANIEKSETAQTEILVQEQVRVGLGDEMTNMVFESAYTEPLMRAGAVFIDRSAIMRLTQSHAGKTQGVGYRPDKQVVETDALIGYADMIAEILMTPDTYGASPLGMAFQVNVTDVRTGQRVLSFVSQGIYEDPEEAKRRPKKYEATSAGFVEKTEIPRPEKVAKRLALETMLHLSQRWGL